MTKKQDPIRGWQVELGIGPIGRPVLRATNTGPDAVKNDYIEASIDETEDGVQVAREAIERAILREQVRRAPDDKQAAAQEELDAFTTRLEVTRQYRARLAILDVGTENGGDGKLVIAKR